jgi:hypothetical protein
MEDEIMKNLNEKSYDTVLTEANDYFMAQGCSIIGEGYKEIASNAALFESYVDQLTEGCSADDAATLAQLMANTNSNILRESSMTGIQPIASLSMPVIRKLWPKFALKEAIATEVAKSPRFVVSYTKPYMMKGEKKVYIPRPALATYAGNKDEDGIFPEQLKDNHGRGHVVILNVGTADTVDFRYLDGKSGEVDENVVIKDTPSAIKTQPVDGVKIEAYVITGDAISTGYAADKRYVVWDAKYLRSGEVGGLKVLLGKDIADGDKAYELVEEIKLGKRLGVTGSGVYNFNGGQLIAQLDGANCKLTLAAIGGKVLVSCAAHVSSEYNEDSWSVGFDIARQDIDIPTGEHLNAPLPIEALNDMMALYQIDGTKETVDLMTNIFAQKLDIEILDFIRDSLAGQPRNEAFFGYGDVSEFAVAFDCKPAAGFAGSPKAWREEIKPLIDHLAQKIKNATYLQGGTFSIVCNPIDAQILANVDWSFRGGVGGNIDGVAVDYSVGTYVGANAYKVIASVNVPAGAMYIVFTPAGNTQMTYKYYPYTFSTEMGYVDPNRSRTPSIMMTKRHTFHEFMPAVGCVVISNNDGKWFNRFGEEPYAKLPNA